MAKRASEETSVPRRRFELRDLWRVALWGMTAAAALLLAVLATTTDAGNDRLILALAHFRGAAGPPAPQASRSVNEPDTRRLAETVRALAADRDRLLARISTLERSVDTTGSVTRPPDPTSPAASAPQPSPMAATSEPAAAFNAPAMVPTPRPAPQTQAPLPEPASGRTEFGIDLGSATTVEGLRVLWTNAKAKHGSLLDGLRPVMTVRDHARPGGVELRLVAGPLTNATAAARLCAALIGAVCQPAVYEGQKLALR